MYYKTQMMIKKKFRTQYEFAQRLKMNESMLSLILNGRRKLDDQQRRKWARLLGCKVTEVLSK